MTADAPPAGWLEWLTESEPEIGAAFGALVSAARDASAIAPADRELLMFAVSCAMRNRSSSVAHATRALQLGTSDAQLRHAVVLAALSGGLPVAVHGVEILRKLGGVG